MTATASFTEIRFNDPVHRRRRRSGDLRRVKGESEQLVETELNRLGISAQYESRFYYFDDGSGFRPDFYLPELQIVIEVTTTKWEKRKREKIARFQAAFPRIPVLLIGHDQLAAIKAGTYDLVAELTTLTRKSATIR